MLKKICCYCVLMIVAGATLFSCSNTPQASGPSDSTGTANYPEKGAMIVLTDRPPQLETPLHIFKQDITPNEYFFVRWHLSQILTRIDIDTFKLYVDGAVDKPLALTMNDLKTKFAPDSVIALAICSGNSRGTFSPRVPGLQWQNGSMGNAKWKGVKLKDILAMAGIDKDAKDVSFQGLDRGVLPGIPPYVKSLDPAHAMDGEVLVAYEMNGQPIPMLNGYPLKLVVPGWYATYWVGALSNINVLSDKFKGFWMEKAYRVTTNAGMTESPDSPSVNTTPLTTINMHSIFVSPEPGATIAADKQCVVEGLAFNDGTGINKVEVSVDDGKNWTLATLNPELGKYSWRRWKYSWTPGTKGAHNLCVRATDNTGKTQPEKQWNKSGYARGFIEHITITAN